MLFYCKDCDHEFEVDDKECQGYYNWKCPNCYHIAPKKDMALGIGIVWNCDTGTVKRSCHDSSSESTGSSPKSCCQDCCQKGA